MKQNNGFDHIAAVLIVAAVLVLVSAGYYFSKRNNAVNQNSIGDSSRTASTSPGEAAPLPVLVSALLSQWGDLSHSLTAALGFGPGLFPSENNGSWSLGEVQIISNNMAFIEFEDGHKGNIALLKYTDGQFSLEKIFPKTDGLSDSVWLPLVNQYGTNIVNYHRNTQGRFTKVDYNVILDSNVK